MYTYRHITTLFFLSSVICYFSYIYIQLYIYRHTYTMLYTYIRQFTSTAICTYLAWIVVHYVASNLYIMHCSGNSWWGFVVSPFYTSTTYCQGLSWIIFTGSRQIVSMWVALGTFFFAKTCMNPVEHKSTSLKNRAYR